LKSVLGELFNFIGAVVRWIYGSIWRTIFQKPKFTFVEYLRGPKQSDDWFDQTGHTFVNRIIGFITLMLLILLSSLL